MRSRFGCLFLFVCLFVTVLARVPACRIVVIVVVVIDTAHIFYFVGISANVISIII